MLVCPDKRNLWHMSQYANKNCGQILSVLGFVLFYRHLIAQISNLCVMTLSTATRCGPIHFLNKTARKTYHNKQTIVTASCILLYICFVTLSAPAQDRIAYFWLMSMNYYTKFANLWGVYLSAILWLIRAQLMHIMHKNKVNPNNKYFNNTKLPKIPTTIIIP